MAWVAVLALRIVLIAGEARVLGDLVREAHRKAAVSAVDMRIGIIVLFVDLAALAGAA